MQSNFLGGFGLARLGAAAMLVIALADLPYGYYTLLRIVVCAVGAYGAYSAYNAGRRGWMWVFAGMAVLFNPIIPVYLDRETWSVIDILAAVTFLSSIAVLPVAAERNEGPLFSAAIPKKLVEPNSDAASPAPAESVYPKSYLEDIWNEVWGQGGSAEWFECCLACLEGMNSDELDWHHPAPVPDDEVALTVEEAATRFGLHNHIFAHRYETPGGGVVNSPNLGEVTRRVTWEKGYPHVWVACCEYCMEAARSGLVDLNDPAPVPRNAKPRTIAEVLAEFDLWDFLIKLR